MSELEPKPRQRQTRRQGKALLPGMTRAAALLLEVPRLGDVAGQVGISRTTLYQWLRDPNFVVYLNEQQARTLEQVARRLVALCLDASEVLENALRQNDTTPEALRACDIVLKRAPVLLEAAIVHVRLADLERRLLELGVEV